MPVPTHYQVLGISPGATHDEIRRAYRAKARRHHPDARAGSGSSSREERDGATGTLAMATINAAWHILRDPARRRAYDVEIGLRPGRRPAETAPGSSDAGGAGDGREWAAAGIYAGFDEDDRLAGPARPADLLVMVPVVLVVAAVAMFFFSTMTGAIRLRNFALVLLPVSGVGFVAAPLVVILRGRSRDMGR